MTTTIQVCHVQQASNCFRRRSCKRDLDTRVQQPQGLLNTRQTCAACEAVTRESYPHWPKGWCGDFPLLNRKTALRHTVAGTWRAPLRRVLALGHAENSQSTGQQMKENVSPLTGARKSQCIGERDTRDGKAIRFALTHSEPRQWNSGTLRHSEDCGFLSLFHFRSDCCKRVTGSMECSTFLLGGFSCFLLSLLVLISLSKPAFH